MTPTPRLTLVVAAGGAAGALLRHGVDLAFPDHGDFAWTTLSINVVGAFFLALLPAIGHVRRSPTWAVALGPGLLGGFTTLSAASEHGRALLADDRFGAAAAYVVGTLVACLVAVTVARLISSRAEQDAVARTGGAE